VLLLAASIGVLYSNAVSASVIFTGTGSGVQSGLEAEAIFDLSPEGNLLVTLTNTSAMDVMNPAQILTGVFFSMEGNYTLTPLSAVLTEGSTVFFPPSKDAFGNPISGGTYAGGDVGSEWAYAVGLNGPRQSTQGISSSGLGLFGPEDRFDPVGNLQGPSSPDGLQYGITSAGDNPNTGNSPVTGGYALLHNSVLFSFGVPTGFDLEDIYNVSFQYGTSLGEPNVPGDKVVPEPSTLALAGLGALCLGFRKRSQFFGRKPKV